MRTKVIRIFRNLIVVACLFSFIFMLSGCSIDQSGSEEQNEITQEQTEEDVMQDETEETAATENSLDKYSWAELSDISNEIAKASDHATAVNIAAKYGLCESDGEIDSDQQKEITLADGTIAAVQIIGFAHDSKVDGGKAGITFIFKDSISNHPMNKTDTNKGGWKSSEIRSYLEGQLTNMPKDLQKVIVEVNKKTNNTGKTDTISSVTTTQDKLWLLSAVEIWGEGVDSHFGSKVNPNLGFNMAKVFNEEGKQYQLFVDLANSDDYTKREFFDKDTTKHYWWSRSPYSVDNEDFKLVGSAGDSSQAGADAAYGVVPCFCI